MTTHDHLNFSAIFESSQMKLFPHCAWKGSPPVSHKHTLRLHITYQYTETHTDSTLHSNTQKHIPTSPIVYKCLPPHPVDTLVEWMDGKRQVKLNYQQRGYLLIEPVTSVALTNTTMINNLIPQLEEEEAGKHSHSGNLLAVMSLSLQIPVDTEPMVCGCVYRRCWL